MLVSEWQRAAETESGERQRGGAAPEVVSLSTFAPLVKDTPTERIGLYLDFVLDYHAAALLRADIVSSEWLAAFSELISCLSPGRRGYLDIHEILVLLSALLTPEEAVKATPASLTGAATSFMTAGHQGGAIAGALPICRILTYLAEGVPDLTGLLATKDKVQALNTAYVTHSEAIQRKERQLESRQKEERERERERERLRGDSTPYSVFGGRSRSNSVISLRGREREREKERERDRALEKEIVGVPLYYMWSDSVLRAAE
ncbi:hypothetical protein KIPB_009107, partial [Kipferlia bialata]|eukprot:g9107.t1